VSAMTAIPSFCSFFVTCHYLLNKSMSHDSSATPVFSHQRFWWNSMGSSKQGH